MKKLLLVILFIALSASFALAGPVVEMKTNIGAITLELDKDKAPLTVENFLKYVEKGFYDGTIFHRVIKGFMIQGGGYDATGQRKSTDSPVQNEAANGLKNSRGTIAMARTNVINSATSQFFINLVDNDSLNHRDTSARGYGYAVFGRVIKGMDVVDQIGRTKTYAKNNLFRDYPQTPIVIESVTLIN